jgi:rhomboid family GlyGly-CTERM serine protease
VNAEVFALTASAARGGVWRLWTGHLVHYGIAHLATNVFAIGVPLTLVDRRDRWAILVALMTLAPAISIALLTSTRFDEYRGASGLAMAVWMMAALSLMGKEARNDRRAGVTLLLLVVAKLVAETMGTGHVWAGVAPLPLAHVAGAVAGVIGFFGFLIQRSIPFSMER